MMIFRVVSNQRPAQQHPIRIPNIRPCQIAHLKLAASSRFPIVQPIQRIAQISPPKNVFHLPVKVSLPHPEGNTHEPSNAPITKKIPIHPLQPLGIAILKRRHHWSQRTPPKFLPPLRRPVPRRRTPLIGNRFAICTTNAPQEYRIVTRIIQTRNETIRHILQFVARIAQKLRIALRRKSPQLHMRLQTHLRNLRGPQRMCKMRNVQHVNQCRTGTPRSRGRSQTARFRRRQTKTEPDNGRHQGVRERLNCGSHLSSTRRASHHAKLFVLTICQINGGTHSRRSSEDLGHSLPTPPATDPASGCSKQFPQTQLPFPHSAANAQHARPHRPVGPDA